MGEVKNGKHTPLFWFRDDQRKEVCSWLDAHHGSLPRWTSNQKQHRHVRPIQLRQNPDRPTNRPKVIAPRGHSANGIQDTEDPTVRIHLGRPNLVQRASRVSSPLLPPKPQCRFGPPEKAMTLRPLESLFAARHSGALHWTLPGRVALEPALANFSAIAPNLSIPHHATSHALSKLSPIPRPIEPCSDHTKPNREV